MELKDVQRRYTVYGYLKYFVDTIQKLKKTEKELLKFLREFGISFKGIAGDRFLISNIDIRTDMDSEICILRHNQRLHFSKLTTQIEKRKKRKFINEEDPKFIKTLLKFCAEIDLDLAESKLPIAHTSSLLRNCIEQVIKQSSFNFTDAFKDYEVAKIGKKFYFYCEATLSTKISKEYLKLLRKEIDKEKQKHLKQFFLETADQEKFEFKLISRKSKLITGILFCKK